MNINDLLNQFLGNNTAQSTNDGMNELSNKAKSITEQVKQSGVGGFAGGAVAGGLLTLLLSNKKVRNTAGSLLGYGGAAVLGAMACKAYQNYKAGKTNTALSPITEEEISNLSVNFQPENINTTNGEPFAITLIKGMIAAAKADGHIDETEQKRIFTEVDKMNLIPQHKAIVFDALSQPVDLDNLTRNVTSIESASELYLISLLAIDPDNPAEQAYLSTLAEKMKIPSELALHLQQQAKQGIA